MNRWLRLMAVAATGLSVGACSASATHAASSPTVTGNASLNVAGAIGAAYSLDRMATESVPGDRVRVTFSSMSAQLLVEIPRQSGDGSVLSFKTDRFFITDCAVPVHAVGAGRFAGAFDCPALTNPNDATEKVDVKGQFSGTLPS